MSQGVSPSSLSPTRQPFVYLLAALAVGIQIARWLAPPQPLLVALALTSVVASATLLLAKKEAGLDLMIGVASVGALLSLAELRTDQATSRLSMLYESRVITPDEPFELTGTLESPPEPGPVGYFLDVAATSIRVGDQERSATGKARLMIQVDEPRDKDQIPERTIAFHALALRYGSHIRMLVRLERARSYSNPGSPDLDRKSVV